jgi:hypothetical protein
MITNLKLIDYGVPRDRIALFNIPSFIAQLTIPIIVSRITAGSHPMKLYFTAFPYRLVISVAIAIFVYLTPTILHGKLHDIPMYYYAIIMMMFLVYQVTNVYLAALNLTYSLIFLYLHFRRFSLERCILLIWLSLHVLQIPWLAALT